MSKTFSLGCGIIVVFMLSGCFYVGDYEKYADTMEAHSVAESQRISSQSKAIMDTVANTQTKSETEATLLAVIGMMNIERLRFVPLNMTAPTTGMDVLKSAVGFIPIATMGLTTYKIAERGFEAAGTVALNADSINVDDAFNSSENHATGESNNASPISVPEVELE